MLLPKAPKHYRITDKNDHGMHTALVVLPETAKYYRTTDKKQSSNAGSIDGASKSIETLQNFRKKLFSVTYKLDRNKKGGGTLAGGRTLS